MSDNRKIAVPSAEPQLATLQIGGDWKIVHHRLFDIDPAEADHVKIDKKGYTVWDLYFLQDLLLLENSDQHHILDVGWYPHADSAGTFRLLVVQQLGFEQNIEAQYDWEQPIVDFETRSLDSLLKHICEATGSYV